jgi:hypothetical protein
MFFTLYEAENDKVESILKQSGKDIIETLLVAYSKRDIANFIGVYLRVFTNSTVSNLKESL